MYYTKGVFGVLNLESLPDEPMVLLDGGIESRYKEDYFFDNSASIKMKIEKFPWFIRFLRQIIAAFFGDRSKKGCSGSKKNSFAIRFILMEALFFLFLKSLRSTAAVLFQLTRRQTAFKRRLLFIRA